MKRSLIALTVLGSLMLSGCALTGGVADFQKYLVKDEVTLDVVNAKGSGAAFVVNGTAKTLAGVTVRLVGSVKAENVKGALSCRDTGEGDVLCRVDTSLNPNDGRALYFTGTILNSLIGYSYQGEPKVYVHSGRVR